MAKNEAVLIIDVQKAFCDAATFRQAFSALRVMEGVEWDVVSNQRNAARIRDFAAAARGKIPLIWTGVHPAGHGYDRWTGEPLSSGPGMPYLAYPDIKAGDALFYKNENDAFDNWALAPYLRELGVEKIHLAGMNYHACVAETACGARAAGFEANVLDDLTSTIILIPQMIEDAEFHMDAAGVTSGTSGELLARLAAESLPKLGSVGDAGEGDFRADVTGLRLRADPQL